MAARLGGASGKLAPDAAYALCQSHKAALWREDNTLPAHLRHPDLCVCRNFWSCHGELCVHMPDELNHTDYLGRTHARYAFLGWWIGMAMGVDRTLTSHNRPVPVPRDRVVIDLNTTPKPPPDIDLHVQRIAAPSRAKASAFLHQPILLAPPPSRCPPARPACAAARRRRIASRRSLASAWAPPAPSP